MKPKITLLAFTVGSLAFCTQVFADPPGESTRGPKKLHDTQQHQLGDQKAGKREPPSGSAPSSHSIANSVGRGAIPNARDRLVQQHAQHRAERKEGMKDPVAWRAGHAKRREAQRGYILAIWGDKLKLAKARAEVHVHVSRMARLDYALDYAEKTGDAAKIARVKSLIEREISRTVRAMDNVQADAGAP